MDEGKGPPERRALATLLAAVPAAALLLLAANWALYALKVGFALRAANLGVLLAGTGVGLLTLLPALLVTMLFFFAIPWEKAFPRVAADPMRMKSLRFFLLAAFSGGTLWGIEIVLPRFFYPEKAADLAWHSQTVPSQWGGHTEAYSNSAARAISFLTVESFFALLGLLSVGAALAYAGRSSGREGFSRRGIGFLPHAIALLLGLAFVKLALAKAMPVFREGGHVRTLTSPNRGAALDAAVRLGPDHKAARRTVVESLKHPDPEIRIRSAGILKTQGRTDLQELAWPLLLDDDPKVRKAAAGILRPPRTWRSGGSEGRSGKERSCVPRSWSSSRPPWRATTGNGRRKPSTSSPRSRPPIPPGISAPPWRPWPASCATGAAPCATRPCSRSPGSATPPLPSIWPCPWAGARTPGRGKP